MKTHLVIFLGDDETDVLAKAYKQLPIPLFSEAITKKQRKSLFKFLENDLDFLVCTEENPFIKGKKNRKLVESYFDRLYCSK
ncbi:MAG TPA: hypothetical protein VKN18_11585 [Blastocatellia bacterium]|nr:hypothetical protein [Blastocatellia bacterium]